MGLGRSDLGVSVDFSLLLNLLQKLPPLLLELLPEEVAGLLVLLEEVPLPERLLPAGAVVVILTPLLVV
jgi:hypothetical protein